MLSLPLTTAPNCWGFLPLGNDMVRGLSRSGLKRNFGTVWHCICNCVSSNFEFFFLLLKLSVVCIFWIVLMCWCQKWFLKNEKTSLTCISARKAIWKAPATTLPNTFFEKHPQPHCQTRSLFAKQVRHFAHKIKKERERKEKEAAH